MSDDSTSLVSRRREIPFSPFRGILRPAAWGLFRSLFRRTRREPNKKGDVGSLVDRSAFQKPFQKPPRHEPRLLG